MERLVILVRKIFTFLVCEIVFFGSQWDGGREQVIQDKVTRCPRLT